MGEEIGGTITTTEHTKKPLTEIEKINQKIIQAKLDNRSLRLAIGVIFVIIGIIFLLETNEWLDPKILTGVLGMIFAFSGYIYIFWSVEAVE